MPVLTRPRIKPPRTYPSVNAVMAIRFHINQNNPTGQLGQFAVTSGQAVHVGTIPAGSFVLPASKHVVVAFNGTTPAVDVGSLAVPAGFGPSAQIAPGAIGFAGMVQGAQHGYLPDDTPVFVKLTAPGNSAGELDFLLPFYTNAD